MPVKMKNKVPERRCALRADRVIAVQHRLIKRNAKKLDNNWSLSTTQNMSASGMLFVSTQPYQTGDVIEVSVVMSGVIDVVKGNAEVVRVTERGHTAFNVAVKFIAEKPKNRPAKSHF
ncbi:MAG: PilZ domain-containing protein [Candidatus Omnitrophica bacterium]|nr:PilZ domain-containing protein [Candidatus Omnitrophota bacterium]